MIARELAQQLGVWERIERAFAQLCSVKPDVRLLEQIGRIPIRSSRATTRLGCYVYKGKIPVCIRLQFAQNGSDLGLTFLHEIAHACDHLTYCGRTRRLTHGESWRQWAQALGINTAACSRSFVLSELHHRRKKLVAVCQDCGASIYRVRRLNRHSHYVHAQCGGRLKSS